MAMLLCDKSRTFLEVRFISRSVSVWGALELELLSLGRKSQME